MKRFLHVILVIVVVFSTSSAGLISPETASSPETTEGVVASKPATKSVYELSGKELRKFSLGDMQKFLGRKMTGLEKIAFKINKKKYVAFTKMGEEGRTNTMAIVGFASSLLLPPLGIIFGIIALGQINKRGESGRGWAIAAIVVGSILTVAIILMAATATYGGFWG